MALGLIAAGLSLIGPISKTIQGFRQKKAAKNLKKSNFIPSSLQESLGRLKMNVASSMIPGYNRAKENINQSTSNSIRAAGAGSISDKLSAAQSANVAENDALVDLETQGAQFQQGNEDRLNQGLTQKANVELENERTFQRTKQALLNSGSQNIFGGFSDMASVGTTALAGGFGGSSGISSLKKMGGSEFMDFYNKSYRPEDFSPEENIEISKLKSVAGRQLSNQSLPNIKRISLSRM